MDGPYSCFHFFQELLTCLPERPVREKEHPQIPSLGLGNYGLTRILQVFPLFVHGIDSKAHCECLLEIDLKLLFLAECVEYIQLTLQLCSAC